MIYNVDNFPYNNLLTKFETVRHHKISYYNVPCAFDIETTTIKCPHMETCPEMFKASCLKEKCESWIKPFAYMYIWQACIDGITIVGRTWKEFTDFCTDLQNSLGLKKKRRLVFYVHNLSYEFQFMKDFILPYEIFAFESGKVIKCMSVFGIEFRCSWKLSNMSLEKFCQNTPGVEHGKKPGYLDYNKIRTPSTILSEKEMEYCIDDVRGLHECIRNLLKEDTIASIPLTSTGYVRRDMRMEFKKDRNNIKRFQRERITEEQYYMLKEAFRGGNTHANYIYSGHVIEKARSKDIASSYPFVMMTEKYPGKFIKGNINNFDRYLKSEDIALLFTCKMTDVVYKGTSGIPYISVSKCREINRESIKIDNGRILECKSFITTLTEIDIRIIKETYSFSIEIGELYISKKKYLPLSIRKVIMKYFEKKSLLKGDKEKEYEYMKSKNKLNSTYGMMVTDPVKEIWEYNNHEWSSGEVSVKEALDKYYSNYNSFLSYQHGVWVTAYARRNLHYALEKIKSDVIYVDTDSVKYINDHENDFNILNGYFLKLADSAEPSPLVEHDGKKYLMGQYEDEGIYEKFVTWGAKKYCYEKDGEIHTTVAGLSKKEGAKKIKEIGIENFSPGLVFYPSGRTLAVYNEKEIHTIEINGEKIITASNLALIPTTYKLSIDKNYKNLLTEYL